MLPMPSRPFSVRTCIVENRRRRPATRSALKVAAAAGPDGYTLLVRAASGLDQ